MSVQVQLRYAGVQKYPNHALVEIRQSQIRSQQTFAVACFNIGTKADIREQQVVPGPAIAFGRLTFEIRPACQTITACAVGIIAR